MQKLVYRSGTRWIWQSAAPTSRPERATVDTWLRFVRRDGGQETASWLELLDDWRRLAAVCPDRCKPGHRCIGRRNVCLLHAHSRENGRGTELTVRSMLWARVLKWSIDLIQHLFLHLSVWCKNITTRDSTTLGETRKKKKRDTRVGILVHKMYHWAYTIDSSYYVMDITSVLFTRLEHVVIVVQSQSLVLRKLTSFQLKWTRTVQFALWSIYRSVTEHTAVVCKNRITFILSIRLPSTRYQHVTEAEQHNSDCVYAT